MWFRNILRAKRTGETSPGGKPAGNSPTGAGYGGLPERALRLLDRLTLDTDFLLLRLPAGARPSAMRQTAADFREHRQYAPGDDFRYVDWKASARQEHIFVRQGEAQTATTVFLLVDTSLSMTWGKPAKSAAALTLAHALSYLALAGNDRLVVVPTSGWAQANGAGVKPPILGPLWGKGQATLLGKFFRSLRFREPLRLEPAFAGLNSLKLARGGLVIVLSDLLGVTDLAPALGILPAPAWRVVFLHLLHPDELDPTLNGYLELQDVETAERRSYRITPQVLQTYRERLETWQDGLAETCKEQHAIYTPLSTGGTLETEMLPQLLAARVVKRQ